MQSGVSRELFESWCSDKKNGCIVAGYCVEGTLAKLILSHPTEITAMNGQKLPLNMKVEYISFSAHTDYPQTSGTDLVTGCVSNNYYLFKRKDFLLNLGWRGGIILLILLWYMKPKFSGT